LISSKTKRQIKEFLNKWIDEKIGDIKSTASNLKASDFRPDLELSKKGLVKPFTAAFLVEGILRINEFERTLTGGIGSSFEECAKLIAEPRFKEVKRGFLVQGDVTKQAISEIEKIVNSVEEKGMSSNYLEIVKKIVSSSSNGDIENRVRKSDLYLKDKEGNELFFEIKSPKPNKDQCVKALEKHLHIHAMKKAHHPKVRTYFAFAFNPYGKLRRDYNWSFVKRYTDLENHVLLGKEFWDLIGGPGTNEEIIRIYKEVGKEKGKHILEQLST